MYFESLMELTKEALPWATIVNQPLVYKGQEFDIWDKENDLEALVAVSVVTSEFSVEVEVRQQFSGKGRGKKPKVFFLKQNPKSPEESFEGQKNKILQTIISWANTLRTELAEKTVRRKAIILSNEALNNAQLPKVKNLVVLPSPDGCNVRFEKTLSLEQTRQLSEFLDKLLNHD